MAIDETNVERYLAVGNAVVFELDPRRKQRTRYKTALRGWTKGRSIAFDRPCELTGTFVSLREGMECGIRFIAEGTACSFSGEILEWDHRSQTPCVRLTWPQRLTLTAFRKFERMAVHLPCVTHKSDGTAIESAVVDLSLGGCGIESPDEFEVGDSAVLDFALPDGTPIKGMKSLCRSCVKSGGSYSAGFQFDGDQSYFESDIAFYIRSTLERYAVDGRDPDKRVVLIIDSNRESGDRIHRSAARHADEVQLAASALDGIYRVRASRPPALVVVRQDLFDLSGIEVCKLLKSNPLTKDIPICLFGGARPALEHQVKSLGVEDFFEDGERMLPNLLYAIGNKMSGSATDEGS